jgi:hypothetical protein
MEHLRRHGASNLRTFRDGSRVLRKILRERLLHRASLVVDHVQLADRPWDPHLVIDFRQGHGERVATGLSGVQVAADG